MAVTAVSMAVVTPLIMPMGVLVIVCVTVGMVVGGVRVIVRHCRAIVPFAAPQSSPLAF